MGKENSGAPHRSTGTAGFNTVLQEVMDSVEDDLLIVTSQYRVKLANAAISLKSLEQIESPVGKHCYEVFQGLDKPCHAPLWDCPLMRVLQSGNTAVLVYPYRMPGRGSATDKYIKLTMWPLRDSNGRIDAVVEVRRDVTPERELETDVLRRHYHLDVLSNVSSAVSGLWDLNEILNVVLDAVLQIFRGNIGIIFLFDEQTQEMYPKAHRGVSARFVSEMRLAKGEGISGKVAQTGEPILVEDISLDPGTARRDLVSTEGLKGFISVPLKAKEKVVGVMDIASIMPGKFNKENMYLLNSIGCQVGTAIEQAKLYQVLSDGRKRYQTLLRQALTIQEEERKRIARELHDETAQELTALALNLQAISEMLEMIGFDNDDIKAMLKKTHAIAVRGGTELTKLIRELRPTLLDTLGLPAAIRRFAESNLTPRGIAISSQFKGLEQRLPPEMELALFRIVQEAISNIARHSEAKNATIVLEYNANKCTLQVEDDGRGFDINQITSIDSTGRGAGLFGMRERLLLLGGKGTIDSQPGKGTRVKLMIPVTRSKANAEDKGAGSG